MLIGKLFNIFHIIETLQNYFTRELPSYNITAVKWHFSSTYVSGGHIWWQAVWRKCFAGQCCPFGLHIRWKKTIDQKLMLCGMNMCYGEPKK